MSFITKIKTKLNNLWAKNESSDLLGISLRHKSLALCSVSTEGEIRTHATSIPENQYSPILTTLSSENDVKGQTHLVLSPHQAQMVQVDKPNVPEEELLSALKWQIKDLVSVAPDNMLLDYFDGPNLGGVEKLHVACTSLSDIKNLIDPLLKEPFTLRSVITEEFAFSHLIEPSADASLLVCQQPNEEVVLIIVKDNRIFFYRRLRGFAQIASKNEAELEMGLIDNLSLEIQRSTDYFERQLKQAPIKSIEVIVPMPTEGFLARKLSENTNVEVNLLSLPENFETYRASAAAVGAIMPAYREAASLAKEKGGVDEINQHSKGIESKDVNTHG